MSSLSDRFDAMPAPEYNAMPVQSNDVAAPKAHSQVVYHVAIPQPQQEPQIIRPNVSNVVLQQPQQPAVASVQSNGAAQANGHHQRRPNNNQRQRQQNQNQNQRQQQQQQRQNHFHTNSGNNGNSNGRANMARGWFTHSVAANNNHNTNRVRNGGNLQSAPRPQSVPNGYRASRGGPNQQRFRSAAQQQQHPYKRPVQFQPRPRNLPAFSNGRNGGGNHFQQRNGHATQPQQPQQRMRNNRNNVAVQQQARPNQSQNRSRNQTANRNNNKNQNATGKNHRSNQNFGKGNKGGQLNAAALDRDLNAYLMKNPDAVERDTMVNANLDKELDDYWKHNSSNSNNEDNETGASAQQQIDENRNHNHN